MWEGRIEGRVRKDSQEASGWLSQDSMQLLVTKITYIHTYIKGLTKEVMLQLTRQTWPKSTVWQEKEYKTAQQKTELGRNQKLRGSELICPGKKSAWKEPNERTQSTYTNQCLYLLRMCFHRTNFRLSCNKNTI